MFSLSSVYQTEAQLNLDLVLPGLFTGSHDGSIGCRRPWLYQNIQGHERFTNTFFKWHISWVYMFFQHFNVYEIGFILDSRCAFNAVVYFNPKLLKNLSIKVPSEGNVKLKSTTVGRGGQLALSSKSLYPGWVKARTGQRAGSDSLPCSITGRQLGKRH